jgi:hypothetical protein
VVVIIVSLGVVQFVEFSLNCLLTVLLNVDSGILLPWFSL